MHRQIHTPTSHHHVDTPASHHPMITIRALFHATPAAPFPANRVSTAYVFVLLFEARRRLGKLTPAALC